METKTEAGTKTVTISYWNLASILACAREELTNAERSAVYQAVRVLLGFSGKCYADYAEVVRLSQTIKID